MTATMEATTEVTRATRQRPRVWPNTVEGVDMPKGTCSVEGCEKPHDARGFCRPHYARWSRYGDPLGVPEKVHKVCSADGCDKTMKSRGLCTTHYERWRRHGDHLVVISRREPVIERLLRYTEGADDPNRCWIWTGVTTSSGYGLLSFTPPETGIPTSSMVHRISYEHFVGPIPDGHQVDHLCHTNDPTCTDADSCPHRLCLNPTHLEAVTPRENSNRMHGGMKARTHCANGHEYNDENTTRNTKGHRVCRTCERAKARRWYRKSRGLA